MRILKVLLAILGVFILVIVGAFYYFTSDLPSLERIEDYQPNLVTKVYSDDGQVIGEYYIERRVVVPLKRLPDHLIEAFLAAEDARFYEHEGISFTGIFRAFMKNMRAGKIVQGGSTITQQLAKSFLQNTKRSYTRKLREAILATRIERQFTKDEILGMYLNQIYFGNGAYGIQTAAEGYFGRDVDDLSVAESALLAGLPKAPSRYSPYNNFELAKERQEFILQRMHEEGFITLDELETALAERIDLEPREARSLWVGPYFTEHVRRYVENKYGTDTLYRGGLKVYTTLDVQMQRGANRAVVEGLRAHDKRRGYRGPVKTLKSLESIEQFKEQTSQELEKHPLAVDGIYEGVVTEVDSRRTNLTVDIGYRRGVIRKKDIAWAKLYNPTNDPDGGKYERFEEIFHPGDVVQVRIKGIPANPGSPLPLELEQEPLAQGSLLAVDPETGFVKAMVGGYDFKKSEFNRATQAVRQPGSAYKPIIYTAALDSGYTPATIVIDSPLVFEEETEVEAEPGEGEDAEGVEMEGALGEPAGEAEMVVQKWRPRNYDEQFYGPITVREALAKSRNVVTIKILRDIGVTRAIEYSRKMGITSPLASDLSLALGSSAVTLKEMVTAFSTLAGQGRRAEPVFIKKILDKDGFLLEENGPEVKEALSPQTAYLTTDLLKSVVEEGTGWRARALKRPSAGKTGTTNNLNDAWYLGYVPNLVAGAWVGYDEEKPLGRYETGSRAALPIWLSFMKEATAGTPVVDFTAPEGIEFAKIDPKTGLLATPSTKNPVFEVFKSGTVPAATAEATDLPATSTDFFMMDTGLGGPSPASSGEDAEGQASDGETPTVETGTASGEASASGEEGDGAAAAPLPPVSEEDIRPEPARPDELTGAEEPPDLPVVEVPSPAGPGGDAGAGSDAPATAE